jgi:8-oxo-dGTP pyrophosphatase MutT (NUDIX family)
MGMDYNKFLENLKKVIEKGLPGWEGQKRMISYVQKPTEEFIQSQNPKRSSVLIWLYPEKGKIFTRLILRADSGGVHGGQVALPGGRYEESDQNLWNTALREANEEIGLPPEEVQFIGALTPLYVIPSNFMVYPFIGAGTHNVPVIVDNIEVQATIGVEINMLLDDSLKEMRMLKRRKTSEVINTPCYIFHGHVVWGATAMMLSEFEELLKRI